MTQRMTSTQRVLAALAAVTVILLSLIGFGPGFSTERVAEGTPQADAQDVEDYRAEQQRKADEEADKQSRDADVDDLKRTQQWKKDNLPEELRYHVIFPIDQGRESEMRVNAVNIAVNASRVGDLLGAQNRSPSMMSRTQDTDCLRGKVAAGCGHTVEYRDDLLTTTRQQEGELIPWVVFAHETMHFVVAAAGGDAPGTPTATREARANCLTGVWVATLPDVDVETAGVAFQKSALRASGPPSYNAYQRGFDLTRSKVNALKECVTLTV